MSKEETQFEVRFIGLELIEKTLIEPKDVEPNSKFVFRYTADFKLSIEKKIAWVMTEVKIIEETTQLQLANFKGLSVFGFPYFEKVFTILKDDMYDVPVELEIYLKNEGLSTMRGILYSELRGTYLSKAVLPLIDVAPLIFEARKKIGNKQ